MSFVLDFETRSAVDLKKAGAYRYAEDPSTVVLMLGYARPGEEPDWWQPGEPFPEVLVEAARSATEPLHAHNALFERLIWNGPLRRVVPGLPILPASAWDCTMARGAAAGWPLKLERLGEAMDLHQQKDPRGSQLVAAWGNAKRNPRAETFPDLVEYCRQDVRAESAALLRLPALSKRERQVWLLDQTINDRGVGVDVESARAIKALLTEAVRDISANLHRLTGGAVDRPTQAARIRDWANERLQHGPRIYHLPDLTAETVERALSVWDWSGLDPAVREVLSARQEAGGAAVKKIDAMLACVCSDGRARGLLQYHAANTGRWGGRLIQPQNFPRPTQKIDPAIFRAVRDDPRRVREMVETFFGGVFTAAADALRPLLWSPPGSGKIIRRADLNAIEARTVLWLAGHEDAMAIFRSGHCIYCEQASAVYGRKIVKAEHPSERQVGKVIVLGCFGPDTRVLTTEGYTRIVDITTDMRVWDGERWVTHGGVVARGIKRTIRHLGVAATPDHRVWTGRAWAQWGAVGRRALLSRQALATASASLPSSAWTSAPAAACEPFGAGATAATPFLSRKATYVMAAVARAQRAPRSDRLLRASGGKGMPRSARTTHIASACSTAFPPFFSGAITPGLGVGVTMAGGASTSGRHGAPTGRRFWRTCSGSPGGTLRSWSLTGRTTRGAMSPVTSASSPAGSTSATGALSASFSGRMPTFDLALSGPRRRFVIWTAAGPMLVHNCGYQMGATRFQEHAAANGIIVTLAQAEEYVRAYRTRWHGVPKLWYGLERAAWAAVLKGGTHSHAGCDFAMHEGALCCRIPSGRVLRWQGVEVDQGVDDDRPTLYVRKIEAGRWKRLSLYGGLITERVTQALARDVMVHGMMLAEEAGLPAILTVHDEVVTEPLVDGPSVRVLEECMTTVPRWAPGLPLAAEGAEGPRYGK